MAAAAMEVISNFILKPSPSTSLPNINHLPNSVTPLTVFDRAAGNFHFPVLMAFRSTMPSNSVLTESLSRVLAPYPHLAGTIDYDSRSGPSFVLNNAGVRLVETRVNVPMDEKDLIHDPTTHGSLYPRVHDRAKEVFQVQLNRYACGGMVIGFTASHTVADGHSMFRFLARWVEAARGLAAAAPPPPPSPPPYYNVDRNSLFVPRNPPACKYDHRETESKQLVNMKSAAAARSPVDNLTVQFPAEFISELKRRVPYRCTTFECLLAHVWKKIVIARGHDHDERTRLRIAVNGRGKMRPVVPMDYFGNVVCWALPTSQVGEVVSNDVGNNVSTIRKAVKQLDDSYFRSFIDFGEILDKEGGDEELMVTAEEWGDLIYPDIEVDSWLGFPMNDMDFGTGGAKVVLPPDVPVEGVVTLVDSFGDGEKGGVNVYLTLRREHVDKFTSICLSLD
ncbi:tryptamine hydroxycinnamoyltransferase 2-like [Iris pallida]|uniref:Tryptamine hydroxycinnamoyltransferase 2-like n=1 Tax=Iris pallida TaxID=29817 RepID=A0AAX6HV34_IRIPA|nr:tryptamine hydroxycinnamoyltransferase 2-like [Iris pallida]